MKLLQLIVQLSSLVGMVVSQQPSESPSLKPSALPSLKPSTKPSRAPSESPSLTPSAQPSLKPSTKPSLAPSESPSLKPSALPSLKPSTKPSLAPSEQPSLQPSESPSIEPSTKPSEQPSNEPTPNNTDDDIIDDDDDNFNIDFWCMSGGFGDPHISTFDDLRFDCQAAGEFVMVQSPDDPNFMIQERFTSLEDSSCTQSSVSTGMVRIEGGAPKIQISTPRTGQPSLNTLDNQCPIDFYVNGVAIELPAGDEQGKTYDNNGNLFDGYVEGPGHVFIGVWGNWIYIYNTETWEGSSIQVEASERFGCHFAIRHNVAVRQDENKFGLLGKCNYDSSDDWVAKNGTTLLPPATAEDALFETAYNYCTQNWCVDNSADSLFTYGVGESFEDINKCDATYENTMQDQVATAPQELLDLCGSSVACMIDGLCGDMSDASRALENEALINATNNGAPQDWEIIYNGLIVDFSVNSDSELRINYDITVDRDYETELFESDCETPIPTITITLTSDSTQPKTAFHNTLSLAYDIDKDEIASSNIWNEETNTIEVCQVVRLFIPESGIDNKMVIVFDERVMTLAVGMSANFQLDNDLEATSAGAGSGETNVDSYVQACKCDGVQFNCNSDPLLPNTDLAVCVWSVDPEVEIDFLDSMFVVQGETTMTVVENSQVRQSSITLIEYKPGENGVVVTTRVPPNLFTFESGQIIAISGAVELQFSEIIFRKLLLDTSARRRSQKNIEKSSYEVNVELTPSKTSSNSASFVNNANFLRLGIAIFLLLI